MKKEEVKKKEKEKDPTSILGIYTGSELYFVIHFVMGQYCKCTNVIGRVWHLFSPIIDRGPIPQNEFSADIDLIQC